MLASDTLLQNRYLVVSPVGKGGMGAVYLAKDQRLRSTVALKETFFEDESLRKAFEREAELLANLRHSALPRVIDHFTEDKGQFLVMEFITGDDLEAMLKRKGGAFSPDEALTWADQLLDALDYLHTQQPPIIHRDIKPQNLKLTSRNQIILLDFGLAKGSAGDMSQVAAGSVLGYTPTYAPLEQVHGVGTDPRSDLYSLAATIYHLMTGATPPDALTRASAVLGGKPDPLKPAHELNAQVPPAVSTVLSRAMALHGDQRHADAAEMRKALADARSQSPPLAESTAQATVIVPAFEDHGPAAPTNVMQDSSDTVIDIPAKATAAIPLAQPPAPKETQTTTTQDEITVANKAEATSPLIAQAARKPNRLPMIIGGVVVLLVAGVIIALIASMNSGTDGATEQTNSAANQSPPAATPASTQKTQTTSAPAPAKSDKSGAQPAPKPETSPTPGASKPNRPLLDRLRNKRM
jgi:serine/threonine protein kinase